MTPQDQQQQQIQSVGGGETVRDQDKIMLILSYIFLLCLIPLLTVKDSEYVKWHARQGTALSAAGVAFGIIFTILGIIPIVNIIAGLAGCVAGPAFLVVAIIGIVKALGGQRWRIPLVADLAEKINL